MFVYSHIGGVKSLLKGGGVRGLDIFFLKSEGKEVERKRIKIKRDVRGGGWVYLLPYFWGLRYFFGGGGLKNSPVGVIFSWEGELRNIQGVDKFSMWL